MHSNIKIVLTKRSLQQAAKDRRNNFLRRTKATAPPDTTESTTETIFDTTTNKYTRRGISKFKSPGQKDAKKDTKEVDVKNEAARDDGAKIANSTRQPSLNGSKRTDRPRSYVRRRLGGANGTSTIKSSSATSPPTTAATSRRPVRVASRRRPLPPTTPLTTTTTSSTTTQSTTPLASEESLQDIEERESIENPALKPRVAPFIKKTVKIQRRPLSSFKDKKEVDQNPSATNEDRKGQTTPPLKEDDRKRQSKKFSSSFKQNQLDEVLRQKSKSQEEYDVTTDGVTNDDTSAETAVAIAAHQLLSAPLPPPADFEDKPKKATKKATKSHKTTQNFAYTSPDYTDFTEPEYFSTPGRKVTFYTSTPSAQYSSTSRLSSAPSFRSTLSSVTPNLAYSSTPSFSSTVLNSAYTSEVPRSGYSSTVGYSDATGFPSSTPQRPSGFTTAGFLSGGFSISPPLGPSTARYLETSNKYVAVPVNDYGYTGLSQEPSYFTREYLLESPVTKTYDDEYQYLSPVTTRPEKKTEPRRISTTLRPTEPPAPLSTPGPVRTAKPRRTPQSKPFEKVAKAEPNRTYRPIENYDYYDEGQEKLGGKYEEDTKVIVHGKGTIECLDIGNFPHPISCKKFISCARMESGALIGWEYVCPKGLSFDPVGGICNWSAGLGCDEN